MGGGQIVVKTSSTTSDEAGKKASRRRYDSPARQQRSAETREHIIATGSALVHELPKWDWTNITARAVGERAGLSERTVNRYFPSERKLRDAVIQRLVQEAGVSLQELELYDFENLVGIMFSYLSSFAAEPITAPVVDPTLAAMDQFRCDALRNAVARATPDWCDRDRENMAAVFDILWNLPPYERLVQVWGFDAKRASGVITWLIGFMTDAIHQGYKPELNS